ncbi:MAG: hypothetical protein M3332_08715 [Actinomycetota bacterium]|nr:hypothetical protein [Actinomycetota bacterium]
MTAQQRPPVFDVHIRPMFRLLDREHMMTLATPPIDLWDLDAVWAERGDILARVRGEGSQNMPGVQVGGPWPPEWVTLFERWLATGSDVEPGHHLVLAKPDGPYKVRTLSGNRRRLTATVIAPTDGCRVWFELDSVSSGQRNYTLHLEPAFPSQPADPTPLQAIDPFMKGDATKVVIRDADGTQEVPIP